MSKLKPLLIAIALIPLIGLTQEVEISSDFTVSSGTPYDVINAGSKKYISLDNGYIIMAKMGGGIVNLQKYDVEGMKEVSRNTYDDLPKYAKFQDFIKLKDRLFYIYESYEKKTQKFTVYSREVDTKDATFKAPVTLLTTSRAAKNSKRSPNLSELGTKLPFGLKFLVKKSFDESKVMIHYTLKPLIKDDTQNYDELGFFVFDNEMNKIWGKEVKLPYTEEKINNICYSVSSKGDAKIVITNRESKEYEVLTVSHEGNIKKSELGLSAEQLVREFKMKEDESGNFVCEGFYANGIEVKVSWGGPAIVFNVNGLMYFEMDSENNLIKQKNFNFSKEFIMQNLNDRLKNKVEEREKEGKAGILDLNITHTEIKEDGSLYIIGERQYVRKEMYGPTQARVYHYGNMVMMKITPDGELAWLKKLPKNQAGIKGAGQMSLSYMQGKSSDYIAYVDNPKNIKLDANDGIPASHKDGLGGFLTTYKVNHESGALEKHTLLDLKKVPGGHTAYQFRTSRIIKASEGVFLLEVYIKGKKDTMVKFSLN